MAVPANSGPVAERPVDRLAQADADVLGGVMPVDVEVARAGDRQVHQGMPGEQLEHVVEEPDAGLHVRPPLAVEVERQADVGLAGLAHDLGGPSGVAQGMALGRKRSEESRGQSPPRQAVDLGVGAHADPQALGIALVAHEPDQDPMFLELLECLRAGGPPVAQTKFDWLSGTT